MTVNSGRFKMDLTSLFLKLENYLNRVLRSLIEQGTFLDPALSLCTVCLSCISLTYLFGRNYNLCKFLFQFDTLFPKIVLTALEIFRTQIINLCAARAILHC